MVIVLVLFVRCASACRRRRRCCPGGAGECAHPRARVGGYNNLDLFKIKRIECRFQQTLESDSLLCTFSVLCAVVQATLIGFVAFNSTVVIVVIVCNYLMRRNVRCAVGAISCEQKTPALALNCLLRFVAAVGCAQGGGGGAPSRGSGQGRTTTTNCRTARGTSRMCQN